MFAMEIQQSNDRKMIGQMKSKPAFELPALAANKRSAKDATGSKHPVKSQRGPLGIPILVAVTVSAGIPRSALIPSLLEAISAPAWPAPCSQLSVTCIQIAKDHHGANPALTSSNHPLEMALAKVRRVHPWIHMHSDEDHLLITQSNTTPHTEARRQLKRCCVQTALGIKPDIANFPRMALAFTKHCIRVGAKRSRRGGRTLLQAEHIRHHPLRNLLPHSCEIIIRRPGAIVRRSLR
jgi:hypothetical protein